MHTKHQPALFTGKTNQWNCIVVSETEVIMEAVQLYSTQIVYIHTTTDTLQHYSRFFLLHLIASFHIEAWYNFILYMLSVNFALECFTAVTSYRCTKFSNFLSYFLSTVQIHNIASLQVLCNLCLPHILLYIHSAGPRLAQVSLHPFTAFTRHSTCSINTPAVSSIGPHRNERGRGAKDRILERRSRCEGTCLIVIIEQVTQSVSSLNGEGRKLQSC